ncbi:hypothetical protein Tco_0936270 [Tanacetum coccineum]
MFSDGLWKIRSLNYPHYDLGLIYEIDSEIRYKIHVMKEKLSQEKPSLDEIFIDINSSLESVIAKLSQDNMEMPWGTLAPDMNDDARISGLTSDFPT